MKLPKQNITKYLLGGKSQVTLKNVKTGNTVSIRIEAGKKKAKGTFFIKCLSEYGNHAYVGFFKQNEAGETSQLFSSYKTCFSEDSKEWKTCAWLVEKIASESMPDAVEVHHNGSCSRCGRELTDPDSIASGFGPVCRKKLSI